MTNAPTLTSVGSLIIDDIYYEDGRKVYNVLGGAGVFAIYGMRVWENPPQSQKIGYIVQKGFDHPKDLDEQLDQLNVSLISKQHSDKHTTHGINRFGANDHRDFEYKYPIIRTTTNDYPDSWVHSMKMVHIISIAERAMDVVNEWRQRDPTSQTQFIWEPLPWACLPENFSKICEAAQQIDIISPNHEEIADMLGFEFEELLSKNNEDFKQTVEFCSEEFFKAIDKSSVTLVIRASKYGAFINTRDIKQWVPAYWNWKTEQDRVVDVTGAGNAFCGGYAAGWVKTQKDPVLSALYGTVSASYVVEQIGVPHLFKHEQWNQGPNPSDRLELLIKKGRK
ncbi:Ribokinase-like protein [Sporodiniella umbellata]|nr:Ribokinase-like protein [Sporodiniella umbellata]